jgi:uncharacterized protein (TIGR02453 family)
MASFTGFPPEALTFYAGLERDNSKAYFDAHRDQYEEAVREPLELLVADLSREFGTGKVFRPYRDVRFSKDKSPYKLQAAAVLRPDGATCSSYYVGLSSTGLHLGGGMWEPDRGQLERARRAIADDKTGPQLERLIAELDGGLTFVEPDLKTAPRGFDRDHPRIELLRRKRFAALTRHQPEPWLHTPAAAERIASTWRALTPLHAWLERHVGAPSPA